MGKVSNKYFLTTTFTLFSIMAGYLNCGQFHTDKSDALGLSSSSLSLTVNIRTSDGSVYGYVGDKVYLEVVTEQGESSKDAYDWFVQREDETPRFFDNGVKTYHYLSSLQVGQLQFWAEKQGNKSNVINYKVYPKLAPRIISQPSDLALEEGESFQLSVAVAFAPNTTYQWFSRKYSRALVGANSSTLSFENADEFNADMYYVVVSNDAGSIQSDVVKVSVNIANNTRPCAENGKNGEEVFDGYQWSNCQFYGPPVFAEQPVNADVNEGDPVQVNFKVEGFPKPTIRVGMVSEPFLTATNFTFSDTSVALERADESSAGMYVLIAANSQGSVQSNPFHVKVAIPDRGCLVESGSGEQSFDGFKWQACRATNCAENHHVEDGVCKVNTTTYTVTVNSGGYGQIAYCRDGDRVVSGSCQGHFDPNWSSCWNTSVVNGTGWHCCGHSKYAPYTTTAVCEGPVM